MEGWHSLEDLMDRRPPALATLGDIQRFEPWFATLTSGDYAANREAVRHVLSYLATVEAVARDPQLRLAVGRMSRRIFLSAQPFALDDGPQRAAQADTVEPVEPAEAPPFALWAPMIENLTDSDRRMSGELQNRYEATTAQGATAWRSADVIRRNLVARGMDLNVETSAALLRTRLYLERAADSLRDKSWADAGLNLKRADYEIGKVFAAIGR